ncbi:molybdenum cofactor guanylyltransferase [Syntrophus aciditrophicus]|uniref:Probable molybdenum cofactor guanylyltransferase n=1 Tax=Syntrophus aciditrophicus (strain SB) TaxID=56780 RepID=Q2LUZ4_SYNAS|nr:molybdenum cofactor guanylyltransferase [Syntrophus aciditrophicus]ABC77901.1 molybdopterin-guanine dinucleotide biosynthesis protein A [Syntrophus aciditrophicus SB]
MTGIILSGGKSSRMGLNKAFLEINGERLIDRTVKLFRQLFSEVILVTNEPLLYLDQDIALVTDIYKGKGPMGGLYSGLFYASFDHAFLCACDIPYLNVEFIRYMTGKASEYDVVVPETADGFHPLHAIYSRRCLPSIKSLLIRDRLKMTGCFKGMRVLYIPESVIRSFDPECRMFLNINTEQDLQRVLELKHKSEGREV